MIIAGVDIGLDGALAIYDSAAHRVVAMISMPALKLAKGKGTKREISLQTLLVLIDQEIIGLGLKVDQCFIERVSSSPQMGVTSAFQFGRGYGAVEGVVAGLRWPVEYVTAAKWKRVLAVPAEKDDALARACQLLPMDVALWTARRGVINQAQCYGRAEAALIALYGHRSLNGIAMGAAA